MNFGISFGFGVDGLIALGLSLLQLMLCGSACMVQKHLSTSSRRAQRVEGAVPGSGGSGATLGVEDIRRVVVVVAH